MVLSEKSNRSNKGNAPFFLFTILTFLLEFILLIRYNLSGGSWLVYLGSVISFIYILTKRIHLHIGGWWLYIYLFFSFLFVASFKFVTSMSTSSAGIQDKNFETMAATAINVFFVFFISVAILYRKGISKISIGNPKEPIIKIHYKLLFGLAVIFSLTSHVLGIGKMGAENYTLPFHLSGVLQFYRAELFPLLAVIEYSNIKYSRNNKKMGIFLATYSLWAIYECILRLSKSALLTSFLPIIFFEILIIRKIDFSFVKKIAPVVIVTLFLFLIMPFLRDSDGGSINKEDVVESSTTELYGRSGRTSFIVKPFTRVFYSGYLYLVDTDYINEDILFDISKAPAIFLIGGSARYQTLVIDGYPEENHHSSGSSPFIDALLVGGYGLFYIIIFLYVLFACIIDRRIDQSKNKLLTTILCVAFYRTFDMLSVSVFVDMTMLKWTMIVIGVMIYVNYRLNRQNSVGQLQRHNV